MVFARPVLALVVVFHITPSWCGSKAHLPTRGTDPIAGVRTQAVATLLAR